MGAIKQPSAALRPNAVVNTSVPSGTMTGKFTLARNGLVASSAYPFTSKFQYQPRHQRFTSFGPPIAFAARQQYARSVTGDRLRRRWQSGCVGEWMQALRPDIPQHPLRQDNPSQLRLSH